VLYFSNSSSIPKLLAMSALAMALMRMAMALMPLAMSLMALAMSLMALAMALMALAMALMALAMALMALAMALMWMSLAVEAELSVPVAHAGRFTHREAPLPRVTCWTSSLPGLSYPIASSLPLSAILAGNFFVAKAFVNAILIIPGLYVVQVAFLGST
jgi:hypothetical protein